MKDTLLIAVIFGGFIVAIWLSYKFFMRGFTDEEKVAGLLPRDFKPDWHYRLGDTYVGYEGANRRVAIVDWPRSKVLAPDEIQSLSAEDESVAGLKHRWVVVGVDDAKAPKLRFWFRFSAKARDEWLAKLAALKSGAA